MWSVWQDCVSFSAIAQHEKTKQNKKVDAGTIVSIIKNNLFSGTVSDAGFCLFTMIVTQNSSH